MYILMVRKIWLISVNANLNLLTVDGKYMINQRINVVVLSKDGLSKSALASVAMVYRVSRNSLPTLPVIFLFKTVCLRFSYEKSSQRTQ